MSKKLTILGILMILAITGYFVNRVIATSNPHTWTDGLVGYWSFDGQYTTSTDGTRDISNNGNWGTFYGGVKPTAGIVGQALSFDGVNDSITVPTIALDNTWTIEAWIRLNENGINSIAGDTTVAYGYIFYRDLEPKFTYEPSSANDLGCQINPSSNEKIVGKWTHIVFVMNTPTMYGYINGKTIGNCVPTNGITNLNVTRIGTGYTGLDSAWFDGLMDEVRIYSRALSADEVKQHYDQTRRNLVINKPSGTPPVGWWKMDEATGATVRDYSVNANTGTKYWMSTSTDYGLVDGQIGKALSFDGSDDYVQIPAATSINNLSELTFEVWVKPTSLGASPRILDKGTRKELLRGSYWVLVGGVRASITNAYSLTVEKVDYTGTKFSHIAMTYSDSGDRKIYIYINGVPCTYSSQIPAEGDLTTDSAYGLNIGNNTALNRPFPGSIDDVRIYNYARTADQIATNYRAGAYRTIINTSVPSSWWTDGLVGYWSFDGQYTTTTSGTSAGTRDVSNNGNWGAFNGGVKPVGGVVGQALSFDGVDDYVEATVSQTKTTYSLWVKNGSTWEYVVNNDGTYYVNGIVRTPTSYPIYVSGNTVQIGKTDATTYFNGLIDEVRIYNRVLSADEVMQLYQQTRRNLGM